MNSTSRLREQTTRAQKRQKTLALALLAVLAVGAIALYLPMRRALDSKRAQLLRTNIELAAKEDRAAALPKLMGQVEGLRRQVEQYKPLRGRSDIERAMREISAIDTSTTLRNSKIETATDKSYATFCEAPLKINFEADFVDAMSFIQKIELMDRLTRVRSLSVQRMAGKGSGDVKVSLSLSLFFANAE